MEQKLIRQKLKIDQDEVKKEVSLEDIESLITNRKIALIKKLFPDDSENTVDKLFYSWNYKKYYKSTTDPNLIFKNRNYLVYRVFRGINCRGKGYHSVNIMGKTDEGIPFIHRLNWNQEFEDPDFSVNEEKVKRYMGFDTVDSSVQNIGETIRIQGDLTIKRVGSFEDVVKQLLDEEILIKRVSIWKESFYELFGEELGLVLTINKSEIYWSDTYRKLKAKNEKYLQEKYSNKKELKKLKKYLRKTLGLKRIFKKRIDEYIDEEASERTMKKIENPLFDNFWEKEKKMLKNKKNIIKTVQKQLNEETKQINLRVGNHLLVVANAIRRDTWKYGDFITPKPTWLHLLHDEHGNKSIRLESGVFEVSILNRHITDGTLMR